MGKLRNDSAASLRVTINRVYTTLVPGAEIEVDNLTARDLAKIQKTPGLVLSGSVEIIQYKTFVDFEVIATQEFGEAPAPVVPVEPEPVPEPEPQPEPEVSWEGFKVFAGSLGLSGDELVEKLKNTYKKTELMSICEDAGLDSLGNKEEIIERLLANL